MTLLSTIENDFKNALTDLKTAGENTATLLKEVPAFIKVLEDSHHAAVADLAALLSPHDANLAGKLRAKLDGALGGTSLAEDVDSELGFVLHYLAHPVPELADLTAAEGMHDDFAHVWQVLKTAAPAPVTTADDLDALRALLEKHKGEVLATENGTIIGFGQYEQLDPRWAWTAVNRVLNWLCGIHPFNTTDTFAPKQLEADGDEVRIAIIGDWGTGVFTEEGCADPAGPASAVMKTVVNTKPDYIIHVGDTYYAGTNSKRPPANEEEANLVVLWKEIVGDSFPQDRFFTLNSNHEMYGGALGLYDVALKDPMFAAQNNLTYFSLAFGKWLIGCFDSAYYSPSITYLQGGLGSEQQDPAQHTFLRQFKEQAAADGMKTMLMCHHNAIDSFGTKVEEPLWCDVTDIITPDYWYWGHIHMGAAYSDNAAVWGSDGGAKGRKTKARCIGHSAIPISVPWGFEKEENKGNACWYAKTPLDGGTAQLPDTLSVDFQPRIKNGFALVTLGRDGSIKEEVFDEGDTVGTVIG